MSLSSLRGRAGGIFAIALAACVWGALSRGAAAAESSAPSATSPAPAKFASPDEWRAFMKQVPLPKRGCMKATYPYPEWIEVPCLAPSPYPYIPANGGGTGVTVGNGFDLMAQTSNAISEGVGSFDRVKAVTSAADLGRNNVYSLQLNTNTFSGTPVCNGAADPSNCLGWEQFIYSSFYYEGVFIQNWMINYENACPVGWFASEGSCFKNSAIIHVGQLPITELAKLTVTGTARSGGSDRAILSTGSELYSVAEEDSTVDLAGFWTSTEFNVFGDGGGSEVTFNPGSTIVVRIGVNAGTLAAPSCIVNGTTGETNSLTIVNSRGAPRSETFPYIVFTESNVGGTGSGQSCHPGAGQ
jgi:hypothetical protein